MDGVVELFEQGGYRDAEVFQPVHEQDVLLELLYIERLQEVLGEVLGAAEGHVYKRGGAWAGGPDAPLISGGEGDQEGELRLDFFDFLLDFIA